MQSALIEWLKNNDLERFGPIFEENEVDLETLRLLTDDDLKEIGLAFGPRKRILNLLREEKALDKSGPSALFVGAPVGERRQLTVLFCDLVGFTALSQTLDPEALQVVIRAYEETCASCIVRYEGYVFTCLGDGVVAFLVSRWRTRARPAAPFAPGSTSSRRWPRFSFRFPAACRFALASPRALSWSRPVNATPLGTR